MRRKEDVLQGGKQISNFDSILTVNKQCATSESLMFKMMGLRVCHWSEELNNLQGEVPVIQLIGLRVQIRVG